MPDDKTAAPEKLEDSTDKTANSTPDAAIEEAKEGKQDLSKSVSDYYQARKDGLRDKFTQENLPPQPEFFDSAKEAGMPRLASVAGVADFQFKDVAKAVGAVGDLAKKIGDSASDTVDDLKETGKKIGEGAAEI